MNYIVPAKTRALILWVSSAATKFKSQYVSNKYDKC